MIKRISLLAAAFSFWTLFSLTTAVAKDESFTGSWVMETPGGTLSFALDLTQTGEEIKGHHAAITARARRVDVSPPTDPPSIVGKVDHGVAHVTFKSGYGDGAGEATLSLKKGELLWKITTSTGQHYLPDEATLQREKAEEKEPKKK